MSEKDIKVSVADNLKDAAAKILKDYKEMWLHTNPSDTYEQVERGIKIVKALDFAFKDYGGFEKYFISEWFVFDLITAFGEEKWFGRLLGADKIPQEYKPRCMYGSSMFAEYIYGGIPSVFPLAQEAKRNFLTEEEGIKLYNGFWLKTINVLKDTEQ